MRGHQELVALDGGSGVVVAASEHNPVAADPVLGLAQAAIVGLGPRGRLVTMKILEDVAACANVVLRYGNML
jgi:hypothetical protein